MTVQVRVLVEVSQAENQDKCWVRQDKIETVIPANTDPDDFSDVATLGGVTIQRLSDECTELAIEQLRQSCELQRELD